MSSTGIKTYKGRYTGKQIDDLLDQVPAMATQEQVAVLDGRLNALENAAPAPEWSPLPAIDVAMLAEMSQNRLAGFINVTYEHSTSSGSVENAQWTVRNVPASERFNLTTGYSTVYTVGNSLGSTSERGYYKMRITLNFGYGDSARLIAITKKLILRYTRSTEAAQHMKLEIISTAAQAAGSTTFRDIATFTLPGGVEWFVLPLEMGVGAQTPSDWQIGALRLTFYTDSTAAIAPFKLHSLRLIAPDCTKADPIAMGGVVLRNGDKTATLAVDSNGDIIINGNINLSALLAAQ